MRRLRWLLPGLLLVAPCLSAQDDVILRAMQDEIGRTNRLKLVGAPPYYVEYSVYDGENVTASATLGALIASERQRYRIPNILVRVGDYQFDNTDFVGTDLFQGTRYDVGQLPLDNSYTALRQHFWLGTDSAYKGALEAYSRKRAALRNVTLSDKLADFWHSEPQQVIQPATLTAVDESAWAARVRRLSAVFLSYPAVYRSSVDFESGQSAQYLLTSEGARVRVPDRMAALRIRASAQAPDGMPLHNAVVLHAPAPDLPVPEAEMERAVRQVAEEMTALAGAPAGDAYTGPVLFEGVAGAQLMAEVLGQNLAVPRRPVSIPGRPLPMISSELEGRLGVRVLPEWMDVVDDPTQAEWHGQPLFGHYDVDLEGVPARPVSLVEKGVLRNLLLTRQPIKGFDGSNGHARLPGNFGAKAATIGNLFVRASENVPAADLRKRLIAMCGQRNKPYGLVVRRMDFPSSASIEEVRRLLTSSPSGSARPVSLPILVYRMYPDGREELVRGLKFRGLGTRSLKDIVAASDESFVFDFLDSNAPFALMGGAAFVSEATVVAPSVLIDDLELEPARQELPKPPVVPPPALTR